jgi:hypothetical protein
MIGRFTCSTGSNNESRFKDREYCEHQVDFNKKKDCLGDDFVHDKK